jgi:hypothetical protein
MPSLRFGYSVLISGTLFMFAPHRLVRVVALLWPVAMFIAITATANHFVLDALVGGCIPLVAFRLNRLLLNLRLVEEWGFWLCGVEKPPRSNGKGPWKLGKEMEERWVSWAAEALHNEGTREEREQEEREWEEREREEMEIRWLPFHYIHKLTRGLGWFDEYRLGTRRYSRIAVSRGLVSICVYGLPLLVLLLLLVFFTWEPHIEIAFYDRAWVRTELEHVEPLSGCFNPDRVSPLYNVTKRLYGPQKTEVHAGIPLRMGLDCYGFASTIPAPGPADPREQEMVIFHSYWRTDLAPFGPRQESFLKSLFATQDMTSGHAKFILWSNGDLAPNPTIKQWLQRHPESFEVRKTDISALAKSTALDGSSHLRINDTKAWVDSDLVRLLVMYAYGGVWVDMDSLLTRDLRPLLEHEFVTQWDCYGEP